MDSMGLFLFLVFADAFEESDRHFSPQILFCKMFAHFEGGFFAPIPKTFEVQEVLPSLGSVVIAWVNASMASSVGGLIAIKIWAARI
jgi:hypothetical protein